jgi:uncharacterized protein YjbI with pentapeptide repeats
MNSSVNFRRFARTPAFWFAIGVVLTTLLAVVTVVALLLAGGAKAVLAGAPLIAAVIALGGVFIAQMVGIALEERRTSEARELEGQRAHEAALQNYFEEVGKLLIEQPLYKARPGDSLSTVARAQTLTVLEGLDADRKRILLLFLYESSLIMRNKPVVSITAANLAGANLSKATLPWADLSSAKLGGATLLEARLDGADLSGADLSDADIRRATLSGANFFWADLSSADLRGADLRGADLSDADLRGANLQGARGLSQEQIDLTRGTNKTTNQSKKTELPEGLNRPQWWSKSFEEQSRIVQKAQLDAWLKGQKSKEDGENSDPS